MSQNDADVQRVALEKDQSRLRDYYSRLYSEHGKAMTSQLAKSVSKTPQYKHERNKSIAATGASAAGVGALSGLVTALKSGASKKISIPAGIGLGALLGSGAGELRSRSKLKKGAKSAIQKTVMDSMAAEAKKNVLIHSYLAQPGVQKLIAKRPWGEERYEG